MDPVATGNNEGRLGANMKTQLYSTTLEGDRQEVTTTRAQVSRDVEQQTGRQSRFEPNPDVHHKAHGLSRMESHKRTLTQKGWVTDAYP